MIPFHLGLWLLTVLTAAGLMALHVALVLRTARMMALTPAERLASVLVPPLTTYYAFRIGFRRRSVLWWVLLASYLVLRSLE